MKHRFLTILLVFCFLVNISLPYLSAEEVNRILAGVNEDIITLYDARSEAKWNGRDWDTLSIEERKVIVEQLINRLIVFQEINRTGGIQIPRSDIQAAMENISAQAKKAGFSEEDIRRHVREQMLVSYFARERFSSLVQIGDGAIREHYVANYSEGGNVDQDLLSQDSRLYAKIRAELEGKEILSLMERWLSRQRESTVISINTLR